MTRVAENLEVVRQRLRRACEAAGRDPAGVRLVAVSKGFPAAAVRQALAAGQADLGESYLQEALEKQPQLPNIGPIWHFIGPIQANKTRGIAENFSWAHGVDRERIAERLSSQRPDTLPPLDLCVQVNISGEASKAGCEPAAAPALCAAVARLPRVRLRGLMAIPAPVTAADPGAAYASLRALFEQIRGQGIALDTLSAGMSADFETAIAHGSTLVRVGSAIFGRREP